MAYDTNLADRVRNHLSEFTNQRVEEKKMFSGLAFTVNGKMCINISGQKLMCRFDPDRYEEISAKAGVEPMVMKGKELKGYCYVQPAGFKTKKDFEYWMNLCLDYNERAKSSKKKQGINDPGH